MCYILCESYVSADELSSARLTIHIKYWFGILLYARLKN